MRVCVCVCADLVIARILHRMRILPSLCRASSVRMAQVRSEDRHGQAEVRLGARAVGLPGLGCRW